MMIDRPKIMLSSADVRNLGNLSISRTHLQPRCFRLLAAAGLGFGTSSASSCDEVSSLQTLLESGSQPGSQAGATWDGVKIPSEAKI